MENTNKFLEALSMIGHTENGAVTNTTTKNVFVDQFGKAGNYRGRDINEVFADQKALWDADPTDSLRFIFYLRMITRKTKVNDNFVTDKVQKGQGARDEAFKRLLWVAKYHEDVFNENIWLLPIVGSWRDLWVLMYLDHTLGLGAINKEVIFVLLAQGMKLNEHVNNIKKFMPRIESKSKCTTPWNLVTNNLAKEFAKYIGMSSPKYNKFKASGTAHDFQKKICARNYDEIKWNLIPGKALSNLVNSRFLDNHKLTQSYMDWLDTKETVPFNGYVYELVKNWRACNGKPFKEITLNKQFDKLIATAKEDGKIHENVWCALDTSGSMRALTSANVSALDICLSLGIYFSTLNEGAFHKNVVMFDDVSTIKRLQGNFCDMASDIINGTIAWGSTNFQSIIDLMIRTRRTNPTIPLEDYPTTILVISDMQFNSVGSVETNYEFMKKRLKAVFPSEYVDSLKFVWWDCISRVKNDFPATIDDAGCYFFSGFDGAIVSLLLGENDEKKPSTPISAEEMVRKALSQEILLQVKA